MSHLTTRATAARAVLLLVVTALALSLAGATSSPTSRERPAAAETPVVQVLLPGVRLAPAAAQPVAPAPHHATPAPARTSHRRHGQHARPHGSAHAARRTAGRHHARQHGRHQTRHHGRHQTRHHGAHPGRHPHRHHAPRPRRHQTRHHVSRWNSTGGRDISWPQCPSNVGFGGHNGLDQPMPQRGVRFVIVGLTNGRAFTPNPCLARHLRWVRRHHVHAAAYAFASYPTHRQLQHYHMHGPYDGRRFLGALRNVGYATARYNVATMRRNGFVTPHVWLDVEPSSSQPWSHRHTWNKAVVQGWVRAYRDAGYTVGFYSTALIWREILGDLRLGLPEWRTAGPVSPSGALAMCSEGSFQGGPAVIAQWWTDHYDYDRLCHGGRRSALLGQYFHKW